MKKMMNAMFVAVLLTGGVLACGSDDDMDDSPSTEVSTGGTVGGDEASDNAEVAEFCAAADELAASIEDVLSDPTSGDIADLTQQASDLAGQSDDLIAANPEDTEEINACAERVSDAVSG